MRPTVGVDYYFRRRSYESNQRVENSNLYGCLGWRALPAADLWFEDRDTEAE